LHYFPAELNGIAQSDLEIFRSDDTGKHWIDQGYTFRNPAQYSVSINAMDTLTRYTIGSASNPIRNALKAGISQAICSNKSIALGGSPVAGHIYNWTSSPSGFTSKISNPTVRPKVKTTYYLTETVNTTTCLHNDSVTIIVNPAPDSSWSYNTAGTIYSFKANDTSQAAYKWYFGDGDSSMNYKEAHLYKKSAKYTVRLIVTNSFGCSAESDSTASFISGISRPSFSNPDISIFPNPFDGKTAVKLSLKKSAIVTISLTDINGRELGIIQNGELQPGDQFIELDASKYDLKPGVYVIKTTIDNLLSINRLVKL
jgi:PKD repeat protein